jgi:hypothetical protein
MTTEPTRRAAGKHKSEPVATTSRSQPGSHRAKPLGRRRTYGPVVALFGIAATAGAMGAALDDGETVPTSQVATPDAPAPSATIARPSMRALDVPISRSRAAESLRPKKRPRPDSVTPPPPTVPETGSGEFLIAAGSSAVVGTGSLTTYTVEVEEDLPFPLQDIARTVDAALTDPRSWTASGGHALQRVNEASDVRVLITTPETTDELCAPLDTGGRLSCRNGELVVLNAWRWVNGAPAFGDNLVNYRRYLINHEFGHALGNPHESCPASGALAPIMMQQTKGLAGCQPNAWPFPPD